VLRPVSVDVRLLPLLALALVLAACGSAAERTGSPGSSGEESETSDPTTAFDESKLRPPRVLLRSIAGQQKAVGGTFCVDYVDQASGRGGGLCSDSPGVHPDSITVAQPGDELTFVFSGADIVRASGCKSESEGEQGCIGFVHVKPLGCEDREVERVPLALGPETRWTVDLEPGAYELDVFGYFESSEGASGDVSAGLGLLVGGGPKQSDHLGVVAVERAMMVCPFPR
jgi:hypothetical protein